VHVLSHAVTLLSHHEVLAKISKWSVNSSQEEHLLLTYGVVVVVHVADKTIGPAAQAHATNHAVDGDAPGWLAAKESGRAFTASELGSHCPALLGVCAQGLNTIWCL
jgi:hypothetical protein